MTERTNPPWLLLTLCLASWTTEQFSDAVAALVLRLPQVGLGAWKGPGNWLQQGIACPVSPCARKVAAAQPVGKQETNCVGDRKRERRERLGLLCGWV